eukprot:Amastigsp_a1935_20.p2 type:complete len:143 gc:universal Amastigsp_a1935_20:810-382(-)
MCVPRSLVVTKVLPTVCCRGPFDSGVDVHELFELGFAVVSPVVCADEVVQNLRDGPRDGEHHKDKEPHNRREMRPDGKPIARAHALRQNLTEDEHGGHRDEDRNDGMHDAVEKDRQRLGGRSVADEQRHKEQMMALDQGANP